MGRFGISPSMNAKEPSVRELFFLDGADHHENLAEQDAGFLLDLQRADELFLGDEPEAHEKTAQVLALESRRGRRDPSVVEVDALLAGRAAYDERAGLEARREPLEQLGQLHRAQISCDGHAMRL
jgi:hypothetical protein